MKLSDYAQKVGVHYRTAYRWFKTGKIAGYQMDTGTNPKSSPECLCGRDRGACSCALAGSDTGTNQLMYIFVHSIGNYLYSLPISQVVALFSPDSARSTWMNRELDFAELHQKKIFPLFVCGFPFIRG
jgi:hypothetical protein